ncbi:MAG: radical SAM protein [Candidatus Aminicenantes bacterium]|nr:radical SAM protein [Candidatus Aminicenantes bacterium]
MKRNPGWFRKFLFKGISRIYLGKPEQAEFLATRYATVGSIVKEGINQFCYLARSTRSPGITSIQIEPTNRCNMKCSMCPVNNGMVRPRGDMDFDLFKKIVDENPSIGFYLLMNWGEPLLHPKIFDMVRYIRSKGGRPFFTTNGVLLTEQAMREVMESGLDRLTISLDGMGKTYEQIRGRPYAEIKERVKKLLQLRDSFESPMGIDVNLVVFDETESDVDAFIKEWRPLVDRVQIQPKIEFSGKRKTRCKEPWRGNIIVLWDGTVVPCCVDYEGKLALGNVREKSLKEIVNDKPARALRALHNQYKFTGPCETCSEYETPLIHPRFD